MFDATRFASGDREYAREVIREHSPLVLMVVQSYFRDYDEAQDLFQEVWRTVVTRARTFKGTGSFKAWLYQVATNLCLSELRSRRAANQARLRLAAEEAVVAWRHVDPLYETEQRQLHRVIHRALAQLTDRERRAITLRVLEGRSPREVAEMMGVLPATVRSHVRHGLNHLRRIMEDEDSELSRYREVN